MADDIGVRPSTTSGSVSVKTEEDANGKHWPIYKMAYGAAGEQILVGHGTALPVADPWLHHAEDVILSTWGDTVSVHEKGKDLLKFGYNDSIGTSVATVQHQPAGILHETYVSDNLINSIISDDAGDTEVMVVEGHTISGGNFTFVVQNVTLTGTTAAALTTPLARVTRVYNNGTSDLNGNIYITETDTYTAGVPDTDTKVHLIIEAGDNQSEKCSTTLSNQDYWIVTSWGGDFLDKTAGAAELLLQVRHKGKVFRINHRLSCSDGASGVHVFQPYYIVPPNSDIRVSAVADGASTSVSAFIEGVLAIVT